MPSNYRMIILQLSFILFYSAEIYSSRTVDDDSRLFAQAISSRYADFADKQDIRSRELLREEISNYKGASPDNVITLMEWLQYKLHHLSCAIDYLEPDIVGILSSIDRRKSIAQVDSSLFIARGSLEFTDSIIEKLSKIMGKILQVRVSDDKTIGSSSACLYYLPSEDRTCKILTCAHSFQSSCPNDYSKFYFVLSSDINSLGQYKSSVQLHQIVSYSYLKSDGYNLVDLTEHQPHYTRAKDIVIASLLTTFSGLPKCVLFDCPKNYRDNERIWHYIGYPSDVYKRSRLTVTHSSCQITLEDEDPSNGQSVTHTVRSSPGMSGGALFCVYQGRVIIVGVCSAITISGEEKACGFVKIN